MRAESVTVTFVSDLTIRQRLDLYRGNDKQREAILRQMFLEAGCAVEHLSEQPVPHQKLPNVICVLPGETAQTIVVGAHFDHVDRGDGIVDNWSGASMLPSLLQSVAARPRKHTFVFVGFTGEEQGLMGSDYYVHALTKEELGRIDAMVNLDTLGLGPTEIWTSQSDPLMVSGLSQVASGMKISVAAMNLDGFGESDEESFIGAKICALVVHSLTPATAHILHSPDDQPKAIRFKDYYSSYRLLAAYLTAFDTQEVPEGHTCSAKPVMMARSPRMGRSPGVR